LQFKSMMQILMLCITCKLLTKVQEFQVHMKNWQKTICGLGLHQKKSPTKLLVSNTTRYDCWTLEANLSILKKYPTLRWSCHNVVKDEKCWTIVIKFYCSTNLKGHDRVLYSWYYLNWSWGFHNHKGMDNIIF
jgi:hypothetical protein